MKLALAFALSALAAATVSAADKPLRLSGGPKSEDALRRFVQADPRLKAKLDDAARREEAFLADNRESDLRDAVSDVNGPDQLKKGLANASGARRAGLLEQLPGMKAPPATDCRTLSECSVPELALDVADAELLPAALRRLVRPWMLLQQSRGSEIRIRPGTSGDAVMTVALKGVKDAPPLTLNVSPRLLGGFKVWFDQPLVLASLYGRERDAALKARR